MVRIMTKNPPLILASGSRYRRELLNRLGLPYEAISADIDETALAGETPVQTSVRLAREKALFIASSHPGSVVIGSDQVADLDGRKLGKPGNRERAIAQLLDMQGRKVVFYSAVAVVAADGTVQEQLSSTTVQIRRLSRETIEAYVDREKPFDCAGSAKIEKLGIALMESVTSDDPTSLIGLPLMMLTGMLARAGIAVLPGIG